jgi:glutamate dehydrogenase (NAD(P)+)
MIPYEYVIAVMEEEWIKGHIVKYMFDIIKNPQRETIDFLPEEMDDGSIRFL